MRAILKITDRGALILPARLRRAVGIEANGEVTAEVTSEGLLLRPAVTLPVEMYPPARLVEFEQSEGEVAALLRQRKR